MERIGEAIYKHILVHNRKSKTAFIDWITKQDIRLPENIVTYDIDSIRPVENLSESGIMLNTNNLKNTNIRDFFEKLIIINDGIFDSSFYKVGNKLFNKAGVELGFIIEWIDKKYKVPRCFKNSNNIVLDPKTGEVLHKYVVYPGMGLYHSLPPKSYKKYRYDYGLDTLISTNRVEESNISR